MSPYSLRISSLALVICVLSFFSGHSAQAHDKGGNFRKNLQLFKGKIIETLSFGRNKATKQLAIPQELASNVGFTNFQSNLLDSEIDAYKPTLAQIAEPEVPTIETTFQVREDLVAFSKKFLGLPYLSRKTGFPFDCSGFTSYILSKFGYSVSRGCRTQATEGERISIDRVKKGDLLFFGHKRGKNGTYISHVAMVVSEEGENLRFIHASRRGIVIDTKGTGSWNSYYAKKILFATRVVGSDLAKIKKDNKLASK